MKGWFFIDLFTSIPTQLFELLLVTHADKKINTKVLRLLRIPRIFKLLRLTKIMKLDIFNMIGEFESWMKQLFSIAAALLFLCHLIACFWFSIAKLKGFPPDSWVAEKEYEDKSNAFNYLVSFYWAFQTIATVGYGDINANGNTSE